MDHEEQAAIGSKANTRQTRLIVRARILVLSQLIKERLSSEFEADTMARYY